MKAYWSRKNSSQYVPFFATVMSYRMFALFQRVLHVGPVGMKNRVVYLQYMPNKRHSRFGIKKFELCEATTGYVLHVELYAGKDFSIHSDIGQAHAVVMKLLREADVLNKGYHLFTDNYYTKPVLAREPSAASTLLTGTVRHNSRGLPALPGRLDIGESVSYRSGELLLVAWREKKS